MNNFESPINIADRVIHLALENRASDIHFEPAKDHIDVRFRIDGILHKQDLLSPAIGLNLTARLKVLSGLNTSERRLPQDGKFSLDYNNKTVDIRVATFPCIWGERVVLRLLDNQEAYFTLENLGLNNNLLQRIKKLVQNNQGCILVTGPTGSGKTTTLHAILKLLVDQSRHIISLEDPVEYTVSGVSQSQVRPEVGFTFANALRAVLRQDPDVIMIGEIRDALTANAALSAALTGHLLLSSVHTFDTVSAIARLLDMGIEPFFVAHALNGILAQRLVRKLCQTCKFSKPIDNQDIDLLKELNLLDKLKSDKLFSSSGCDSCNNIGYKERIGLFEFLELSTKFRALLLSKPSRDKLIEQALEDRLEPFAQQAQELLISGQTSLFEISRVLL